ncbi:hypothetical protein HOY82DRAFT_610886 [Tuber indicum]|nr:hypothetical protein HOY82DRAFT_610886 [Tuber indicum]
MVGGAALLLYGYPILTIDTDLTITADPLYKFEVRAKLHPRFSQMKFGGWDFESHRRFRVDIDFLGKTGEGRYLHECSDYSLMDGMPMVTLTDLAIAKGGAWIKSQKEKDF